MLVRLKNDKPVSFKLISLIFATTLNKFMCYFFGKNKRGKLYKS